MCNNQMSLKWKIIKNLQRRFNRNHNQEIADYEKYILKGKF